MRGGALGLDGGQLRVVPPASQDGEAVVAEEGRQLVEAVGGEDAHLGLERRAVRHLASRGASLDAPSVEKGGDQAKGRVSVKHQPQRCDVNAKPDLSSVPKP